MSHMKPETYEGAYWEIETNQGTYFMPADSVGYHAADTAEDGFTIDLDGEELSEALEEMRDELALFVPSGAEIEWASYWRSGELHRLSAPGFMDSTEWSPEPIESDE